MTGISSQSIFQTALTETSWRSYAVSFAVHSALIAAALAIVVPAVVERKKMAASVTLVMPLHRYQARSVHVGAPVLTPRHPLPPIHPFEPVKLAPRVVTPPPVVAIAPEPKVAIPTVEPELVQLPKSPPAPRQVTLGVFGDSRALKPTENTPPSPQPQVGSFDKSLTSASGPGQLVGVKRSGFGDVSAAPQAPLQAVAKGLQPAGFDGPTTAAVAGPVTPVEILSKPRAVYTEEARGMHLEGQVSLQVIFLANGTIRVIRVVRGLGHGLDEAAARAAQQVRFKPATRGGVPVDTSATINISFELT